VSLGFARFFFETEGYIFDEEGFELFPYYLHFIRKDMVKANK
jgi:hypothetical protein